MVRLKEVVSDCLLVNSGADHLWCERSPHKNIGSVIYTGHKKADVFKIFCERVKQNEELNSVV